MPNAPRPRAVLFDLFHTLIVLRPGGERGPRTWEALGIERSAWERAFTADRHGRAIGNVHGAVENMRVVAHEVDPTIPMERIEIAAEQRQRRFHDAFLNVRPHVLSGLERLRDAGVRVGLVSNASWEEIEHWDDSPLAPRFDHVVFSCAAGVAKPDPAIYSAALDGLGARADETWFVGDGGSDEHRGARAVGLTPVLLLHLLRGVWPERIEERSRHVDLVLEDVEAVAAAALNGHDVLGHGRTGG